MTHYKAWQKAVKGYFRALEITYSKKRDDFHPHFHCILAVPKSYLSSRVYLKHEDWLNMWRRAYKDESIQMVNIKAITHRMNYDEGLTEAENLEKAVAESVIESICQSQHHSVSQLRRLKEIVYGSWFRCIRLSSGNHGDETV